MFFIDISELKKAAQAWLNKASDRHASDHELAKKVIAGTRSTTMKDLLQDIVAFPDLVSRPAFIHLNERLIAIVEKYLREGRTAQDPNVEKYLREGRTAQDPKLSAALGLSAQLKAIKRAQHLDALLSYQAVVGRRHDLDQPENVQHDIETLYREEQTELSEQAYDAAYKAKVDALFKHDLPAFSDELILFLAEFRKKLTVYKEQNKIEKAKLKHTRSHLIGFFKAYEHAAWKAFESVHGDMQVLVERPHYAYQQLQEMLAALADHLRHDPCKLLSAFYKEMKAHLDRIGARYELFLAAHEKVEAQLRPLETVSDVFVSPSEASFAPTQRNELKHYIDAYDDDDFLNGCFPDMMQAMEEANHFILISGWLVELTEDYARPFGPHDQGRPRRTVGEILVEKAATNPDMVIVVSIWEQSMFQGGSDVHRNNHAYLEEVAQRMGTSLKNIPNLILSYNAHPGNVLTFHQKTVVADDKAFYGGLDLSRSRIDNHHHVVSAPSDTPAHQTPKDQRERETMEKFRSNNLLFAAETINHIPKESPIEVPRNAWHDHHTRARGPLAANITADFVERLIRTNPRAADYLAKINPERHPIVRAQMLAAQAVHEQNLAGNYDQTPWQSQVLRSSKRSASSVWRLQDQAGGQKFERSIQEGYLHAIASAQNSIYIENQFFMGGAGANTKEARKNDIPQALVDKIVEKANNGEPFHVYVVLPMTPNGAPGDVDVDPLRYYQNKTIAWTMRQIEARTSKPWYQFITFYCMANWHGKQDKLKGSDEKHTRAENLLEHGAGQVYVHSKLMIVDNDAVIMGSANINERSQAGTRDSEIAVLSRASPGHEAAVAAEIHDIRTHAMEHVFGASAVQDLRAEGLLDDLGNPRAEAVLRQHTDNAYQALMQGDAPRDEALGFAIEFPYSRVPGQTGKLDPERAFLPGVHSEKDRRNSRYQFAVAEDDKPKVTNISNALGAGGFK